MPTYSAEIIHTIRKAAVETMRNYAENVQSLPWEAGLSQIEQCLQYPPTIKPREAHEAKKLIDAMVGGYEFMIAFVFNEAHDKVVALPVPEHYEFYHRAELGVYPETSTTNPETIYIGVLRELVILSRNPDKDVQPNVVLIEQNLGRDRKDREITIAGIDLRKISPDYSQSIKWIAEVQNKLNNIPASGK